MKDYKVSIQQLINILDRVQLPVVDEVAGKPTVIRVNQAQKQAIQIELVNVDVDNEQQKQALPQEVPKKVIEPVDVFAPGTHPGSKKINYVIRDIVSTHGQVMCISEKTTEGQFRVVVNSGCVKYKIMSENNEHLAWHVSECVIRTLALHSGDPADHKRIDEMINIFYDRLDGVINGL